MSRLARSNMLASFSILALFSLIAITNLTSLASAQTASDAGASSKSTAPAKRLKLLYLGDQGHHRPHDRFLQLAPVMARRGIDLTYSERVADLNSKTLNSYDGLVLYANIDEISPEQERALLDYVSSGKGFIPLHCASYCFRNSDAFVKLVGAQFQRHGTGVFRVTPQPEAQRSTLLQGYGGFESWDETYVHTKHNEQDRVVLEYRIEGDQKEPWTWTRTHGQGRVFYTAWGHDARTWSHPGFQNLVERGIRWAVKDDPATVPAFQDRPEMTPLRKDVQPFEYTTGTMPNYLAGKSWGTIGQPLTKMQKPLSAGESVKHFVTPVGFEPRLFATEPQIGKPIAMAWDARGRLWICETVDYPNELQKPGEGRDRIRICEDTDHDGVADKFTVFAEKLSIPTSLAFGYGGVIVLQAPDTLFLLDTNGDDVADRREVLFTGWNTNDTHAGPSNLQYGLDNWYYGIVGYSGFEGMIAGEKQSFRTGFYRFRLEPQKDQPIPKVAAFEFLRNTNNNSWGVGLSEDGVLFGSTANGNPSVYMPIANRYYERVRGWSSTVLGGIAASNKYEPITEKVRQVDWHGGFTAAAGHAIYTARTWPKEYWNRTAFVTEPTGHLIATFQIDADGADYRSRNAYNILASDDEWSAPIMAEVGPDGQLWVIDWYNMIVQHNPTPAGFKTGKGNAYETDLRDKTHGRIYRVVYRQGQETPTIDLEHATSQQLVATLRSPNRFWRSHAQRLLVEQGSSPEVITALQQLARETSVDEIGLNAPVTHALWTLHGLARRDGSAQTQSLLTAAASNCLEHASPSVRRAAIMTLDPHAIVSVLQGRPPARHPWLDPDPQVRLAALLALADASPDDFISASLAAAITNRLLLEDRYTLDALTSAAAAHANGVLIRVRNADHPQTLELLDRLGEHWGRLAQADSVAKLIAAADRISPTALAAITQGAARGWPKDKPITLSPEADASLGTLFSKLPPGRELTLLTLARRWGSRQAEQYVDRIRQTHTLLVNNTQAPVERRIQAAAELLEFLPADSDLVHQLITLVTPREAPEFCLALVGLIGKSRADNVPTEMLDRFTGFTPTVKAAAMRQLLSRPEWTVVLLSRIEQGKLALEELTLDQKQALAAHTDSGIATRARKLLAAGGGLPNPDRQKVIVELEPVVTKSGDPAAGKEVFVKQCSKCHIHGQLGQRVGPDLTGMAVHPKHELLIHILDPNRSVEGNFREYTVVTNDGLIVKGLLASENKTALELVDAEGKKQIILRENVEELNQSSKSLMPEGFEKQIPPPDLANLLEFLTQRGRYVPLPLDKVATVISTKGMFFEETGDVERMIFSDWSPKTFQGVPFHLVNPQGDRVPNAILLHGPQGLVPPRMPKQVTLPCHSQVKAIHLLSGVSGWGFPVGEKGTTSLIVRLTYADGKTEEHPLKNGVQFADYIRRVDVPGSQFAFALRGQQIRYLAVHPQRTEPIEQIELIKGPDSSAPIVMAVTIETPQAE